MNNVKREIICENKLMAMEDIDKNNNILKDKVNFKIYFIINM